jgi:3-oxoacyl-[acyl-carrier protein] reductase
MVSQTIARWGRLDALVNNAGTTKFCDYGNLEGLSKKDFLDLYEVNVVGAYQMSKHAAPYLRTLNGCIVNTSSISAISGVGSSIAYAASKGALSTMTLSLAHALAPEVRVNAVCPGFIQGRWTKGFLGDRYQSVKQSVEQQTLIGRTSLPEDIAKSIVYLIEDAVTTNGQFLIVDGGKLVNQAKL